MVAGEGGVVALVEVVEGCSCMYVRIDVRGGGGVGDK